MGRGLSPLEREILERLGKKALAQEQFLARQGRKIPGSAAHDAASLWARLEDEAVGWKSVIDLGGAIPWARRRAARGAWTRARAASAARALARLEVRGLLKRLALDGGAYTSHIILTPEGSRLASSLGTPAPAKP
jgi:hypothetical protein